VRPGSCDGDNLTRFSSSLILSLSSSYNLTATAQLYLSNVLTEEGCWNLTPAQPTIDWKNVPLSQIAFWLLRAFGGKSLQMTTR